MFTLPAGVGYYGDSLLDETAKSEEGCLNGSSHGADDDESDVEFFGYPAHDVLAKVTALPPSLLGEFGVVDGIVSYKSVSKNIQSHCFRWYLLETL